MKIVTYNVNGIRAALKKSFLEWANATQADVICIQETKATKEQVDLSQLEASGYQTYWFSAEKKGYSGVAVFTKIKPKHVEYGIGLDDYDKEGRGIRVDFDTVSILNVYMPSGSSGDERQAFKFKWMDDFYNYVQELKQEIPNLIVCGDYNICHKAIDIHNPKSNAKSSGFLPEEREWMTKFFDSGFTDSFRFFNQEPHNYTWWSYRAGARGKNLGWRIDYISTTTILDDRLKSCKILPEAKHSDHCPILLEID